MTAPAPAPAEPPRCDGGGDTGASCARSLATRGALWTLGPAAIVWSSLHWPSTRLATITLVAQLAGALLVSAAGLRITASHGWSRVLASVGFMAWGGGFLIDHSHAPGRGFVALLAVVWGLLRMWPIEALRRRDAGGARPHHDDVLAAGVVAALAAGSAWFLSRPSAWTLLPLSATMLAMAFLARRQRLILPLDRRARQGVTVAIIFSIVLPVGAAIAGRFGLSWAVSIVPLAAIGPLAVVAITLRVRRAEDVALLADVEPSLFDLVLMHPPRVMVASFLALCVLATMLLALPAASADGITIGLLDAAFTAVSATCVTGLAVKDTAVDISLFGQVVILLFIQVGGLGIMVFSAAAVVVLGRRLSVQHEAAAVDLVGASGRAGLSRAIRGIIEVSLITELGCAMLLAPAFMLEGDAAGVALWRALFTSVSAFCNAGFALQSQSLMPYAENPFILGVVTVALVIGGIGPGVVIAVGQRRHLGLQARLVLVTSAALLVVPGLLILVLEWGASLRDFGLIDKVTNAFFQSATLRTAGFNSIDFAAVHPATWTIMVAVMFVGGSPGSTAGGAKTTTLAVIVLAVAAIVRGRGRVDVAGRTIPASTILRATAVASVGIISCLAAMIALQLTQTMPLDVLLFEVVSALATVGVSMGATSQLDEVGRVIIIGCMFAGRIGPLTFFMFLASRNPISTNVRLPEEPVAVG